MSDQGDHEPKAVPKKTIPKSGSPAPSEHADALLYSNPLFAGSSAPKLSREVIEAFESLRQTSKTSSVNLEKLLASLKMPDFSHPVKLMQFDQHFGAVSSPEEKRLESERTELRERLHQQVKEVKRLSERTSQLEVELAKQQQNEAEAKKVRSELLSENAKSQEALAAALKTNAELEKKDQLAHLSGRVCGAAWQRLLNDPTFQDLFADGRDLDAFVMSIDIRRSTELMLRAKSPKQYADFLQKVFAELVTAVHSNYGVIDKFTGDGLLVYFTHQFSGKDAAFRVLTTSQSCHAIFKRHYSESRDAFSVLYKDVGLGIGVDFGRVALLRVTDEPTVIGVPVVYACRLAGAPAGETYFNHTALAHLRDNCAKSFFADEVEFTIKHEGPVLCHRVGLTDSSHRPTEPEWLANGEGKTRAE